MDTLFFSWPFPLFFFPVIFLIYSMNISDVINFNLSIVAFFLFVFSNYSFLLSFKLFLSAFLFLTSFLFLSFICNVL
jgi:hypothetical protein